MLRHSSVSAAAGGHGTNVRECARAPGFTCCHSVKQKPCTIGAALGDHCKTTSSYKCTGPKLLVAATGGTVAPLGGKTQVCGSLAFGVELLLLGDMANVNSSHGVDSRTKTRSNALHRPSSRKSFTRARSRLQPYPTCMSSETRQRPRHLCANKAVRINLSSRGRSSLHIDIGSCSQRHIELD